MVVGLVQGVWGGSGVVHGRVGSEVGCIGGGRVLPHAGEQGHVTMNKCRDDG